MNADKMIADLNGTSIDLTFSNADVIANNVFAISIIRT